MGNKMVFLYEIFVIICILNDQELKIYIVNGLCFFYKQGRVQYSIVGDFLLLSFFQIDSNIGNITFRNLFKFDGLESIFYSVRVFRIMFLLYIGICNEKK